MDIARLKHMLTGDLEQARNNASNAADTPEKSRLIAQMDRLEGDIRWMIGALYFEGIGRLGSVADDVAPAVSAYNRAYATIPDPEVLFKLAYLHFMLGQKAEALETMRKCADQSEGDQKILALKELQKMEAQEPPEPSEAREARRSAQVRNEKKGCFIATACYESALAPQLSAFRAYRDERLQHCKLGRAFIRVYYAVSPPIANWLTRHPRAAAFVRSRVLEPLRRRLEAEHGDR
ncbi:MAG: CFI-box-CTERM domain-containing protein [Armatimonadota bacterium]